MIPPETRYARSGNVHIAYQVVGNGPIDLVYVAPFASHVEYGWQYPPFARMFERLASFSRLILFDKRGTGLSDRVPEHELPTLEQRMDDVRAVMDAVGSTRAALFGQSEGGSMSALFAATYPERTHALVLFASFARRLWAVDYPWGPTAEQREDLYAWMEQHWGMSLDASSVPVWTPVFGDIVSEREFQQWITSYHRFSASPGAAATIARMNSGIDIRPILPTIHVPTLVLHRAHDTDVKVDEGRYLAQQIPGARFVELAGTLHTAFLGDSDALVDAIEEFLTGARHHTEPDRALATVLFTDLVGSTARAAALGDRRWRDLLESHQTLVRRELSRFRGREIKTTGDGFLATFDGPARAIRCACAIRDGVQQQGLEIRAGLHTGECELMGDDVGGIAVHIGQRVSALARAGEVLVSSTVRDLVAGSGLRFEDRGLHALKGIPDDWRLLAVVP